MKEATAHLEAVANGLTIVGPHELGTRKRLGVASRIALIMQEMHQPNDELASINAFRALAALWTLAAHCLIWSSWRLPIPIPAPKIAVDLFMMISGFLMAHNAVARSKTEPLSTAWGRCAFWLRRFFRLAPAYYLSLTVAVIFSAQYGAGYHALQAFDPGVWQSTHYDYTATDVSTTSLLLHASFLFGLHPRLGASTLLPDWSLSLEMQFYLAFPFIWMLVRRVGVGTGVVVLASAALLAAAALHQVADYREPSALVFKLQYFLAGVLIHQAVQEPSRRRMLTRVALAVALCCTELSYGKQLVLPPLLAAGLFASALMERRGTTPQVLRVVTNSRLVRFASDVSYSVYLTHGFWIAGTGLLLAHFAPAASAPMRAGLLLAVVAPGAYFTGWVMARTVELPGIALGRRVIRAARERMQRRINGFVG